VFGAALATLSGFFDPPWLKPVDGLSDADKGFILNAAGYRLRALGRLGSGTADAGGIGSNIAQQIWKNAAINAINLRNYILPSAM
jgi:hypothetical protein